MDYIDLHVHTTASDGSMSPAEVVSKAVEIGLFAIAITDHDTVCGVEEAMIAAQGCPMGVVPGVELCTSYEGHEIHLLGLNIDFTNEYFLNTLNQLAELRRQRNDKICQLLRENKIDISLEKLQEMFNNSVVTRANMAEYMVQKGYVSNKNEAFDKYIGNKSCCYVPRYKLPLQDGVKLIKLVGGYSSIAHPAKYKLSDQEYEKLFKDAKRFGVDCIEVYHSDNTPDDENKFMRYCEQFKFKKTGGTDFHGTMKPDISLGTGKGNIMVPKTFLKNIGINIK